MTDEQLMTAYADGDLECFHALYERHKKRLYGFLVSRLKDAAEAEDVFQVIFVKLHDSRQKYRPEIPFLPWLFTIARNSLIDHVRKKGAYRKHIMAVGEEMDSHADPRADAHPDAVAVAGLSSLSASQRQALELRFNQGLPFDEIARQMQTSAGNARQIVSRVIRKLRAMAASKEEGHEKG